MPRSLSLLLLSLVVLAPLSAQAATEDCRQPGMSGAHTERAAAPGACLLPQQACCDVAPSGDAAAEALMASLPQPSQPDGALAAVLPRERPAPRDGSVAPVEARAPPGGRTPLFILHGALLL